MLRFLVSFSDQENILKTKILLFAMAILVSLSPDHQAYSQGITWTSTETTNKSHTPQGNIAITYIISPEVTRINSRDEILQIDFKGLRLYRFNRNNHTCLTFPLLSQTEASSSLPAAQNSLQVYSTSKHKRIGHYNCSQKNILFSPNLAKFSSIAPLREEKFNQIFTESMVSYWVSNEVVNVETLIDIGQHRRQVYQDNPLLRQIDIIGLLQLLEGFPVQISKKFPITDSATTLTLQTTLLPTQDETLFHLPNECSEE